MALSQKRLTQIIKKFEQAHILIIGDLILDQFIWGDVTRISPEAPVPVVHVQKESYMPGGAANVAHNVRALRGNVYMVGLVGTDMWADKLLTELAGQGVDTAGVISASGRQTSLKTRIVAQHQQVVRVDREVLMPIAAAEIKQVMAYVRSVIGRVQAIVIEDYGKGLIVPQLLKQVVPLAKKHNVIVTVDPKEDHFSYYRGVDCITPNQFEAGKAAGMRIHDEADLLRVGEKLCRKIAAASVLITRGEHGMCLFEDKGRVTHIPTMAQEVFDVSGAGDTVIAAFTLAVSCGASFLEAAYLSNCAAGVVVGKLGVATCSPQELQNHYAQSSVE